MRRLVYRLFGVHIGHGSTIHWQTHFFQPSGLQIGEYCSIRIGISLDGRRGLTIGNRVATGSEVMIYTLQHDGDSPTFDTAGGPVTIEDYVYIGPRDITLPSVRIDRGASLGAGAVVTQNVHKYAVFAGVPARFIREWSREVDYRSEFATAFQQELGVGPVSDYSVSSQLPLCGQCWHCPGSAGGCRYAGMTPVQVGCAQSWLLEI